MPPTSHIHALLLALGFATAGCSDTSNAEASTATNPTASAPAATQAPAPSRALRGSIDIDPLLGVETENYTSIFLMGWRGIRQGPPQIIREITNTSLPASFALDARDLSTAGTIAGDWILVARLDGDGDVALGEGDLQGTTTGFVTADGPPAHIFLTEELNAEDVRHAELLAAPAPPPPATESKPGPRFKGTIELSDEYADMNGTRTLFVILKDKPLPRGMPRAVMRLDKPQFPVTFDMGVEHIPLAVENPEALLAGQLYLTARLDGDGNFMGAPGDIELAQPTPVMANEKTVKVKLDTRRQP